MTKRTRNELKENLKNILNRLLPSWSVSFSIRTLVNKLVMILLLIGKLSHLAPAFAETKVVEPQPIVINTGSDDALSVSELWIALNPSQRAILLFLELEVPDLAESLLDETPTTINDFFINAENQLSALPIWSQIERLSADPNLPKTLPANTKELRSFIQPNGHLSIFIAEDERYANMLARLPEDDLKASSTYFESTVNLAFTEEDKTILVDKLSDDLLNEVFEPQSNSS